MIPKLAWVNDLFSLVSQATAGDIKSVSIEEVADPLKKLVVFKLGREWSSKNYKPFQTLAHAFARANDCLLERIRRRPDAFVLEILIKRRLAPESRKNPLD